MLRDAAPPRWSIEIYHVLDHDRQQRILEAFHASRWRHVTALGSRGGDNWFVIVETSSVEDRLAALETIFAIDAHATRTFASKPPQLWGPLPAS